MFFKIRAVTAWFHLPPGGCVKPFRGLNPHSGTRETNEFFGWHAVSASGHFITPLIFPFELHVISSFSLPVFLLFIYVSQNIQFSPQSAQACSSFSPVNGACAFVFPSGRDICVPHRPWAPLLSPSLSNERLNWQLICTIFPGFFGLFWSFLLYFVVCSSFLRFGVSPAMESGEDGDCSGGQWRLICI